MVLLVFPPPDHFWIGRIGAKFANLSDAAGSPTFARRCLLKWHQLRIHGLAAQTRTVSGGSELEHDSLASTLPGSIGGEAVVVETELQHCSLLSRIAYRNVAPLLREK
jgi:hypothetical protein